jgi:heme oxygenase (biliverdin-IX-beta and delta-forming)
MPESWMLARLKRETHRHQITADADRLSLLNGAPSAATYTTFLKRVYGFEAPVEGALAMTIELEQVIDIRGRSALKLLRADLTSLGVSDAAATPRCSTIFPFRSKPEALGWAYVTDRNQLLHGQLYRHLVEHLPAQARSASAYLAMFERGGTQRWRELCDALDRHAKNPAVADRIVAAAQAAFRCQRFWYEDRLPSRVQVA